MLSRESLVKAPHMVVWGRYVVTEHDYRIIIDEYVVDRFFPSDYLRLVVVMAARV